MPNVPYFCNSHLVGKFIISNNNSLVKADVAVIQGYVHEDGKTAPHLTFRKQILDFQKQNKNRTIIINGSLK